MTSGWHHAFAVPAHGQSPHLRECLASLRAQTVPSPVFISTSTPSPWLGALAAEFDATLVAHGPNRGIGHDWNQAMAAAPATWVTLAHQDDVYLPHFVAETMRCVERQPRADLVMTGYAELAHRRTWTWTPMLAVKRLLEEQAFLGREAVSHRRSKRRLLAFGCAIPCPTVTLRRDRALGLFREDLKVDLDWDAWLRLADGPGAFARVRRLCMLHRIHADSETSDGIRAGVRAREDRAMFERLWPAPIARMLARLYAVGYEAGKP
ncbi:glycosyltransferase family 2 protein [Pseudoxanthomonas mexicana]